MRNEREREPCFVLPFHIMTKDNKKEKNVFLCVFTLFDLIIDKNGKKTIRTKY